MRNSIFLSLILVFAILAPASSLYGQSQARAVSYITYEEARPAIELLREVIPAELSAASPEALPTLWPKWVARRDGEIRARLAQGDEDSVINFMLFGTSFTRRPRVTLDDLRQIAEKPLQIIQSRADDLVKAMAGPTINERLLFARRLIESKAYEVKTAVGRERVKKYLFDNLARVLNERAAYTRVLEAAKEFGDPSAEFAERSKLYSARGLSSDTSLLPNFAIEKALASLKAQGGLVPASVRRIAIIGPGLDFTDKQDGYDFYPQQTIQPFAIIDTLLRLGLARAQDLKVTTFDLSPRVNAHLAGARARALRGASYVVQLPRAASSRWTTEAIDYWSKFGDQVGTPVAPVAVPAGVGDVKVRAVRIRAAVVSLITPEDVNVVLERFNAKEGEGYDLIVATNILVYYDVFEQSLALANIQRMLRPGGFLLSNNALPELPGFQMRSVGYESVAYSDRPDDGDHIVWYQRVAGQQQR